MEGPGALHLQVRVQDLRAEAHKQVLAVGPDLLAGHAREIDGGEARYADAGARDLAAGHPLQALGELVDGITFGHGAIVGRTTAGVGGAGR